MESRLLNCSEFPNNWIFIKFTFLKNVPDMLADICLAALIKFDKLDFNRM
ncbi:hypothetical protein J6W78_10775 [bacterium]|nr:hypothetical protein [bacterium]